MKQSKDQGTDFVAERDEIAEGIYRLLAQFEDSRASSISLVDLVHMQFLNFPYTDPVQKVPHQ